MAISSTTDGFHRGTTKPAPTPSILCTPVSPPDRTADHIQALGKVSRMMADARTRRLAYGAESAQDLYKLFKDADK